MTPRDSRSIAVEKGPTNTARLVLVVAVVWLVVVGALIYLLTAQGTAGLVTFVVGLLPVALIAVFIRDAVKH